jgi:hypothetical protein
MLENLVDSLAKRFGIDHALARQTLAMMLQELHEGSEGHLASELEAAIEGLGDVEAAGSGGGGFGLMGEASGLVSGTPQSGLHGLQALLGKDRVDGFDQVLAEIVGEQAGPELGARLQTALARLSR